MVEEEGEREAATSAVVPFSAIQSRARVRLGYSAWILEGVASSLSKGENDQMLEWTLGFVRSIGKVLVKTRTIVDGISS